MKTGNAKWFYQRGLHTCVLFLVFFSGIHAQSVILPNVSFEQGISGWGYCSEPGGLGNVSIVNDSTAADSFSFARFKISTDNKIFGLSTLCSIAAGKDYSLSFKARWKADTSSPGFFDNGGFFGVIALGALCDSNGFSFLGGDQQINTSGWTTYSYCFRAKKNFSALVLGMRRIPGCKYGDVDIDGLQLVCMSSPSLTLQNPSNALCAGSNTYVEAVLSGSVGPVTYTWNNGLPSTAGPHTVSPTISTWYKVIIGYGGCYRDSDSVFVRVSPPLKLTVSKKDAMCGLSNGSATINVTGGIPGYTYSWSTSPAVTTSSATGLQDGVYIAGVTDSIGCSKYTAVGINKIDAPYVTFSQVSNIRCFGINDGSATASVSGGSMPYLINWSPAVSSTETATGLSPGNYTVSIQDDNGCIASAAISLTQPASPLTASVTTLLPVKCKGDSSGNAIIKASGGTAPYFYAWTSYAASNNTAGNLKAGTYTVSVTDSAGCSQPVSFSITEPASAVVSNIKSSSGISCSGGADGTATLSSSGGTPPYSYIWTPGAFTSATATALSAGAYQVNVSDKKGCAAVVSVSLSSPPAVISTILSKDASCGLSNGSATVSATGGISPHTYSWQTLPVQTTAIASGLSAGTYQVMITDAKGCTASNTSVINNTNGPSVNVTTKNVLCKSGASGSATASVSGGMPGYSFLWNTTPASTGSALTKMQAGAYTVTVTDSNGCQAFAVTTVAEPLQQLTVDSIHSQAETCTGLNGSLHAYVSGGTGAYAYTWSPVFSGNASATALSSGTYTVTVTDANGCITKQSSSVALSDNKPVIDSALTLPVRCKGNKDGAIILFTKKSTYVYSWIPAVSSAASASGLSAGSYAVTISDTVGCDTSIVFVISEPSTGLQAIITTQSADCSAGSSGSATVAVNGGAAPYTYTWSFPYTNSATANNLSAGIYSVVVTDNNACSVQDSFVINKTGAPVAAFTINPDTGQAPLVINITNNSSGFSSCYWLFGDGQAGTTQHPTHTYQDTGTYVVTLIVISASGCASVVTDTVHVSLPVSVPPTPPVSPDSVEEPDTAICIPNIFTPNGDGINDIFTVCDGTTHFESGLIINRWGQVLYEWSQVNAGWDGRTISGTEAPEGNYFYQIRITLSGNRVIMKSGFVMLKRR